MARFFVSYSRSVKDEVQKVIDLLRASGHEVWWDGDIPIMADWWATILDKIEWCEVFIFVTSEKSVESPYCIAELKYANDRQRPILPFMLEDPTALELPPQLPSRNQWLIYDGNPAHMLEQINTAYNLIEWYKHNDISTRRPPEPNKGGVSLAKQYQQARQDAQDLQFNTAKQRLQNIKRLDYGEWGTDCDEWLGRISSYEALIDLVDHEATRDKARRDWQRHVQQYGSDFDPASIAQRLQTQSSRLPLIVGGSVIGVVLILLVVMWAIGIFSRDETDTPPQTLQVAQVTDDADPNATEEISSDDARATGAAQAYATLTALAPTETPTITPTPSDTPISSNDIQQTAQAEIFATETLIAQTQAVIAQETQSAVLTEQFSAGSTATYIVQLSLTPPATNTPPPTPTPDTPDPLQAAFTPVTSNGDWTPIEREFNGVTMVLVPAGCFDMGSTDYDDEEPIHEQCFDAPFWIDKYEVTQAQFERLGGTQANQPSISGDNRPVENITWFEARDFCELRDSRLPTEAEWEYTARGPDNLVYPWGNDWNTNNAVWNRSLSQGTADVGSIVAGASWVGTLDMSGNVWEWTSSLYESYPYDGTDGREADTGSRTDILRVLRGGSWSNYSKASPRAPDRLRNDPYSWDSSYGFRCARSYE